MPEFDLAVIGAGSAGLSITAVAAQLGVKVVLIERGRMGGDCLNTGCVPSKALLAAAHAAQAIRTAGRFGLRLADLAADPAEGPAVGSPVGPALGAAVDPAASSAAASPQGVPASSAIGSAVDPAMDRAVGPAMEPAVDWSAVRAHVQGAIAAIAPADSEARYRALGATVLRGQARFVAADELQVDGGQVDGRRIAARRIVVAAGSRAAVPAIPGLDRLPFLTNDTLFDLPQQPAHLLILGGGPIGLEMADAFAGLGSRVTVVEAATIAAREDPELAAGLRTALAARGVTFLEGAQVIAAEAATPAGTTLVLADGRRVTGSDLLVAVGRRPNLEGLELAAGNVQASAAGIVTDRGLRSVSNRRVFAAGDIADPVGLGPRAFTHVGSYHAGIIIRRALFRLPARLNYAALPRVTYTHPELAQVGLTEAEARASGLPVQVLRWPLADNDRAVAEADTAGLVKLVVARGRVVGAGILAPGAGEMIGTWTLAIAERTRVSKLAGMIVPYPTGSEAAKRAAGSLFAPALFSARTRRIVRWLRYLGG